MSHFTLMQRDVRRNDSAPATSLLWCAICVLMLACGCASNQTNRATSPRTRPPSPDEASFAAGASRSPTPATSYAFAKILIGQGRDQDALYLLAGVVREHPKFLPAYNEMATIYIRSDRFDDAVETLSIALNNSPRDGVLLNNLGMCHLLNGNHAEALRHFTDAADYTPTNPIFRANRATALALLGRASEAESDYRSILGSKETRENLAVLARARTQQMTPPLDAYGSNSGSVRPTAASTQPAH